MPAVTIRLRLTAWFALVLALTVASLGMGVYLLASQFLLARVDATLDFEFDEANERLIAGESADALTTAPAAFHDAFQLRILTTDGRLLAQSSDLKGRHVALPALLSNSALRLHHSASIEGIGPCRIVSGTVEAAENRRLVQILTSLVTYHRELAGLRGVLWTVLPAGLALATLGGYVLAGRVLGPVGGMADAARRITAANLAERLEVTNPSDEFGRLAQTLNAMLDRLDRAFAASRRFTADAAHELRTPLASIRAEAEVALRAPRDRDEYEDTLRSIVDEADRLARLSDRLLLLARDDAGLGLACQDVALDEVLRQAAAHADDPRIRLDLTETRTIAGDPDLLRQAIDNLLDNAREYARPDGQISVRLRSDAAWATIEIRDDGPGIPPEAVGLVFDRFYRADPSRSRRTGGTGLGLSIVKAVVERHGGSVHCRSVSGQGSTFCVTLPSPMQGAPSAETLPSIKKN